MEYLKMSNLEEIKGTLTWVWIGTNKKEKKMEAIMLSQKNVFLQEIILQKHEGN